MAEWLGTGLQNPLQRFESASDLIQAGLHASGALSFFDKAQLSLLRIGRIKKRNRDGA